MMEKTTATTIASVLAMVPSDYRLYKIDASIEGQDSVMFILAGDAYREYMDVACECPERHLMLGRNLFINGTGTSIVNAIMECIQKMNEPIQKAKPWWFRGGAKWYD